MLLIGVVAAAIAGGLVEFLLGLFLPEKPTRRHILAIVAAIVVFAIISIRTSPENEINSPDNAVSANNTETTVEEINSLEANDIDNSTIIQSGGGDVTINQALPTSTNESIPTPENTPLANPTPLRVGEPIYFNSLESQTDVSWRVWQDSDGRAGYESGGYYVLALDSKAGWLSANLDDEYRNLILNIDAIPISHGLITGYKIAVGWDESNNYYSFEVQPSGECGLVIVKNYRRTGLLVSRCPQPFQNELIRIRLEVEGQNMRVFINDEYITTMYLSNYQGGKIGLGTYNGGLSGSGAEAKMQFNNLAIWNAPITTNSPAYGND